MAYTPLNTDENLIRLLHLIPGSYTDNAIKCDFSVVSLDGELQYEALSYVWGEASDAREIELGESPVPVTANLFSALRRLRLHDQTRILWVDALCINQPDLQERASQVSRMDQIYGRASQVIVWLGEGWQGSNIAMDFLRSLGEDETLHLDPALDPSVSVHGFRLDSMELRGNLIRLFDLPWWKRTWTVQEFVLAKNLVFQCSESLVTQESMYMARENFWSHKDRCCPQNDLDSPHPELGISLTGAFERPAKLDFVSKRRGSGASYSILLAMASFSIRGVADPRDKVYGMLGLGTGPYTNLVKPDYTFSPEQVCEAVAIRSSERTGKLEFLSHLFDHENPKLPSFMPNWTGPYAWNPVYEMRLDHVNNFSASQNLLAEFELLSGGILITRGVIFDTILATSATSILQQTLRSDLLKELEALAGLESLHRELYCHTNDSLLVAFWHTVCGGMEMVLQDSNRFSRRLKGSTDLSKYFRWKALCTAPPQLRAELWDNELGHTLLDIETATQGRRFFTTEKGYFGLGPEKCERGDLVAVLRGGNVPYILRSRFSMGQFLHVFRLVMQARDRVDVIGTAVNLCAKGVYTILGDSYVPGIMDGEVFGIQAGFKRGLDRIVLV